uniref:Nodulation protein NfeD n=1 Tax=Ignisphaera aggregans TaxID=334771 RepID=A0A7C2ZCM7_9CREN
MNTRLMIAVSLILLSIALDIAPSVLLSNTGREAIVADLNMNIDAGALHFWDRVMAEASDDTVIILKINSYGGYLSVADEIVSKIIENNIECYTWIPPGAYAVSAAAMISLACNHIYMGTGSVIGDAIPIPSEPKVVEYVASRFRALAERLYGNNGTLISIAESMVREGRTLTAEEAIRLGFASKAEKIEDLENILGIKVVKTIEPGLWDGFVSLISLPVVSELLLSVGAMLILVEIFTTGFQGFAIAGVLLIILALYGMNLITPNIFALTLMLSGLVLLAIEMYNPGFGVFGLSGIVLLAIGLGYQIYITPPGLLTEPVYAIIGSAVFLAGFVGFIAFKALETLHRKRISLEQRILSSIGIAKTEIHETEAGVVHIVGEDWTAYSVKGSIPAGSKVRVVRIDGLKLYVERVEDQEEGQK